MIGSCSPTRAADVFCASVFPAGDRPQRACATFGANLGGGIKPRQPTLNPATIAAVAFVRTAGGTCFTIFRHQSSVGRAHATAREGGFSAGRRTFLLIATR